jgi:hypothetical protein
MMRNIASLSRLAPRGAGFLVVYSETAPPFFGIIIAIKRREGAVTQPYWAGTKNKKELIT